MRIKKQNNNSKVISSQSDIQHKQAVNASQSNDAIREAIDYIYSAINSLAEIAKEDAVAKDSIANLSVILLDLKASSKASTVPVENELEAQLIHELENAGIDVLDRARAISEFTANFGYTQEEAEQLYQRVLDYSNEIA